MRGVIWLVGIALMLVSCASDGMRVSGTPSASVAGVEPLTGTWQGVITGRELATAAHITAKNATLVVNEDRTWTMNGAAGRSTGRVVSVTPDEAVLVGKTERDDRPVRYLLHREGGGFLVGAARTYFQGHSVYTGIKLDKVN